jgi:hypothetical protein
MTPRTTTVICLALAFLSTPSLAEEIEVGGGVDFHSRFVDRGGIVVDGPTLTPATAVAYGGASLEVAGIFSAERDAYAESDELDVVLGLETTFEAGLEVTVGVSVAELITPNAPAGERQTQEIGAALGLDLPLAPGIEGAFATADGSLYLKAALAPEFELPGDLTLGLEAGVGFTDAEQPMGFNDATMTASLGTTVQGLTVAPVIGYTYGSLNANPERHATWGGLSVGL